MDLSDSQRQALDQLRELTNGGNDESSISILESVDWNVQVNFLPFCHISTYNLQSLSSVLPTSYSAVVHRQANPNPLHHPFHLHLHLHRDLQWNYFKWTTAHKAIYPNGYVNAVSLVGVFHGVLTFP